MAVVTSQIAAWSQIVYNVAGVVTPYTIPVQVPGANGAVNTVITYTNGTGPLQHDLCYANKFTLVATTSQLDLTALTDVNNVAANMARVRELLLWNTDTVAGHDVSLYQGASNPWAMLPTSANPLFARSNQGFVRISDPNSTGGGNGQIVSGTSKTLIVSSGANTITFWLVILGTSVA